MSLFDVEEEEIEELLLLLVLETPEEPETEVFEPTELRDADPETFFLLLFSMSAIDLALTARAFRLSESPGLAPVSGASGAVEPAAECPREAVSTATPLVNS